MRLCPQKDEPLSSCLCDDVWVVSSVQVLIDVNPEEPEAVFDSSDGKGGVSFPLSLPVVHNQLLCFADLEMDVVVLAPRCQGSDLLSVGRLIIVGDQADDGHVSSIQFNSVLFV